MQSLLGPGADREHLLEMLQSGRFQHMISPMGGSLGGSRAQTSFDSSRPATSQQASASAATTAPSLTGTRSSQHRQQQQQQPQQQSRQQLQLSDLQSALSSVGVAIPQGVLYLEYSIVLFFISIIQVKLLIEVEKVRNKMVAMW